jgi:hypothetical protein
MIEYLELDDLVQPWQINPRQLWSWFDVLQFSARAFYLCGGALRSVRSDCSIAAAACIDGDVGFVMLRPVDDRAKGKAVEALASVEPEFRKIGLRITADTIVELLQELNDLPLKRNLQWLRDQIDAIEKLALKELRDRMFLYIPPERAKFWPTTKKPNIFGEEVANKFPSAAFDIGNGGVCLATTLNTAAVFHLMRVLEIGLAALAKVFGVSTAYTNWEVVLNQIESKIAGMRSDPTWKSLPDCKEQQEYFSQIASYFRTVKDAWRNYTMHSRAKYMEEEAEQIFNAVKGFMQKLSERLAE